MKYFFTCFIALFAYLVPARAADLNLTLDSSFSPSARAQLAVVAREVVNVLRDMFGNAGPTANLPIVCKLGPPPPRASLDDWNQPSKIQINLSVGNHNYAQFAFQLAHELGHVMIGVRRSNQAFETIATAVSLEVLDRLSKRWMAGPPGPQWARYGPQFEKYKKSVEESALDRLGYSKDWSQKKPSSLKQIVQSKNTEHDVLGDITSQRARDLQTLSAMIVRSEFSRWIDLIGVENCTSPSPTRAPSFQVLMASRACIKRHSPKLIWLSPLAATPNKESAEVSAD